MRRAPQQARTGWELEVEALGLTWHTHEDGTPYWDESACYVFTAEEVDEIEEATNNLHQICLQAVDHVVSHDRFAELGIPDVAVPLIKRSWGAPQAQASALSAQPAPSATRAPSLYGRFDLAYSGAGPAKMLEYNADTPTALLEAAVVQWYWMEAVHKGADQFNSLWEAMTARWSQIRASCLLAGETVAMAYCGPDLGEDHMTVTCVLQETAKEAGIRSQALPVKQLGWDESRGTFVDAHNVPMRTVFKLYPWEWMWSDRYASCLARAYETTRWIEPYWKLVLSSKGILALLWELFPGHPNLLEAHAGDPGGLMDYVRKPFFSREGANIVVARGGSSVEESPGTYASERCVYQALAPLPEFDGRYPVIGSWIIGDEAHGMGIRESGSLITDNLSQFVPHYFS